MEQLTAVHFEDPVGSQPIHDVLVTSGDHQLNAPLHDEWMQLDANLICSMPIKQRCKFVRCDDTSIAEAARQLRQAALSGAQLFVASLRGRFS
eukprot:Skav225021  [mRNA]  locus=scaffold6844:24189:26841:+ [translate_table: standard]